MNYQYDGLNETERHQLFKYETLSFFNVLHDQKQHERVIRFDLNCMGRTTIRNLMLCRAPSDKGLTVKDALKREVFNQVFKYLGIDKHCLNGTFTTKDIESLANYLSRGVVKYAGKTIKVSDISCGIPKKVFYENEGWLSRNVLKLFGLEQTSTRVRTTINSESKRSYIYGLCPIRVSLIEDMLELVRNSR